MTVQIHVPALARGGEHLRLGDLDEVVELPPRDLGLRIAAGGFFDRAIGIQPVSLEVVEDHVRDGPEPVDECISHGQGQLDRVAIGRRRSGAPARARGTERDLRWLQGSTMGGRQDHGRITRHVLDVAVAAEVGLARNVGSGVDGNLRSNEVHSFAR